MSMRDGISRIKQTLRVSSGGILTSRDFYKYANSISISEIQISARTRHSDIDNKEAQV